MSHKIFASIGMSENHLLGFIFWIILKITLKPPRPRQGERIKVRGKPNVPPSPVPSPASERGGFIIFMVRG